MPAKGQSVIEYIMIVGIMTIALFSMGPAIKRGVQSLVRATSDQLANQEYAEQDFDDQSGHLDESKTQATSKSSKEIRELWYSTKTTLNETTESTTKSVTNMGFTKE